MILVMTLVAGCRTGGSLTGNHFDKTAWLGFLGYGVGPLVDLADRNDLEQLQSMAYTRVRLSDKEIMQVAAEEAALSHRTVTFFNARTRAWVQADPLIYHDDSVTLRVRVWDHHKLIDESMRDLTLSP